MLTSGLVTELQVTACVFGSTYAFHLIAERLTVCRFSGSFFLYTTYRFIVTRLWSHWNNFWWRCKHGCQTLLPLSANR